MICKECEKESAYKIITINDEEVCLCLEHYNSYLIQNKKNKKNNPEVIYANLDILKGEK